MISKFGFIAGFIKQAEKIRPRVEVVIKDKSGRILLGEAAGDYGKFYKFPGGGIEQGESTIEAGKRETQEETGKNIGNIKPLPVEPMLLINPNNPQQGSKTYYVQGDLRGGRRSKLYGADEDIIKRLQFFDPYTAARLMLMQQIGTPFEEAAKRRADAIRKAT